MDRRDAIDWGAPAVPTRRPLSPLQLAAYLDRICLSPSAVAGPPTAALLHTLVRAHAFAVPFESFAVTLRAPIGLSPDDVFKKLVLEKRGGYCLETSYLLLAALQALSFDVRLRSARVWMRLAEYTPHDPPSARSHVVLLVRASGGDGGGEGKDEWLCDVGFGGGSPSLPLPLSHGVITTTCGDVFRTEAGDACQGEDSWKLLGCHSGVWKLLYSFDHISWDAPRVHAADFIAISHFVQHARGTLFQRSRIASMPLEHGRVTLNRGELRIKGREQLGVSDPNVLVVVMEDAAAFVRAAREHFGIALTLDDAQVILDADRAMVASSTL